MNSTDEQELRVYHRHVADMLNRSDEDNFQAVMEQARHIAERSYETTLYDHQQTFRLLWHHLERTGHLRRVHREARAHVASGRPTPAEAAQLELFLTVYARVRDANPARMT